MNQNDEVLLCEDHVMTSHGRASMTQVPRLIINDLWHIVACFCDIQTTIASGLTLCAEPLFLYSLPCYNFHQCCVFFRILSFWFELLPIPWSDDKIRTNATFVEKETASSTIFELINFTLLKKSCFYPENWPNLSWTRTIHRFFLKISQFVPRSMLISLFNKTWGTNFGVGQTTE